MKKLTKYILIFCSLYCSLNLYSQLPHWKDFKTSSIEQQSKKQKIILQQKSVRVENYVNNQQKIIEEELNLARQYFANEQYLKAYEIYIKPSHSLYLNGNDADNIGDMYYEGKGVNKNSKIALKWYKISAEKGNSDGQVDLAFMLLVQSDEQEKPNNSEIISLLNKSVAQNNADAQNLLGRMYQLGIGVEVNNSVALDLFSKAANQNNAEAQNNLAAIFNNGIGVARNYKLAFNWYFRAIDNGSVTALYNIATMYETGLGVEKDLTLAFNYYAKAAEKGFSLAQYELGMMYLKGTAVDRNYALAKEWLDKSTHPEKYIALGEIYENGLGVKKDILKALHNYETANILDVVDGKLNIERIISSLNINATRGDVSSLILLASIYLNGEGVEKDNQKAVDLYKQAAAKGSEEAKNKLFELGETE